MTQSKTLFTLALLTGILSTSVAQTRYLDDVGDQIVVTSDVVYGSRFQGSAAHRLIYFSHRVANFILTFLVNLLTNINFSDVETGYKVFRKSIMKNIKINENSFGVEIEVTMKIAKLKAKIFEVGIGYNGRTYSEGKKITIKDGLIAVFLIFKYFFSSTYK